MSTEQWTRARKLGFTITVHTPAGGSARGWICADELEQFLIGVEQSLKIANATFGPDIDGDAAALMREASE